jgi:hypothetical protein
MREREIDRERDTDREGGRETEREEREREIQGEREKAYRNDAKVRIVVAEFLKEDLKRISLLDEEEKIYKKLEPVNSKSQWIP